ncbi:acetyltransferase [Xanthomarina sp. F1114]|uniref:acetyltransferase n=1 Tax=Xanthomarina sp. F1114 TaxID=2996019 RepID=UPI00225E6D22|nr:acetyltransferase [Xanthomarina sp. F1114]MCX7548872.1 acetyltransferase [Xanthomarina sp. F1114]
MENIIIVGCGSHAAELTDYIDYINKHSPTPKFNVKGLIDNTKSHYDHYAYQYEFLGTIDDHIVNPNMSYIMGIGNLEIRTKVFQEYKVKGAKFIGVIHPTALISKSAIIGEGTVISHNVSIGPKAEIGACNVINSRCTIGHDSKIGDNNFLSPQVVLGGFSKIGDNNLLGTNACLIPEIEVGNNNKIMAGMAVTNNVKDDETVFFRFKEKLVVRKEFIEKRSQD